MSKETIELDYMVVQAIKELQGKTDGEPPNAGIDHHQRTIVQSVFYILYLLKTADFGDTSYEYEEGIRLMIELQDLHEDLDQLKISA